MIIPFNIRYGIKLKEEFSEKEIPKDFLIALGFFIKDIFDRNMLSSSMRYSYDLIDMLRKVGRISQNFDGQDLEFGIKFYLERIEWYRIFNFIERIFQKIESEKIRNSYIDGEVFENIGSLEQSKIYFTEELNLILLEDGIPFEFSDGYFHRRGKIQTIKNISSSFKVLNSPKYKTVSDHFNLAKKAFDKIPNGDFVNCVKESFCALEALLHLKTGINSSAHFNESLRKITGNNMGNVPKIIAQAIEKLYAYRGDAKGVAHAAPEGSKISENEAELILSLVAAIITYLISLEYEEEEVIPF